MQNSIHVDPQEIIPNRLQSEIHNRIFDNITIQTSMKQTPKKKMLFLL